MSEALSILLKQLLMNVDAESVEDTLRAIQKIINALQIRRYPANRILCHEGQVEDVFYIIAQGSVEILKELTPDQPKKLLDVREQGGFFGEMALILDEPRTAEVRTKEASIMLELDRTTFKNAIHQNPILEDLFYTETVNNLDNHFHKEKAISGRTYEEIAIFTSYSRNDEEFVRQLRQDLQKKLFDNHVKLWLDKDDIPPGKNWDKAVHSALQDSKAMLLILSNASVESDNVADEWHYYLQKEKPIIPIIKETCEIPYRLMRRQHVSFIEESYKVALARVHSRILDLIDI